MDNIEREIKFWLPELLEIRKRLLKQGASLQTSRHLEKNFRLDTPDQKLTEQGHVLRLRQAVDVTLTYKQPGESFEVRPEREVEVGDFEETREILSLLGYDVIHIYEKYREIFNLNRCKVMLDEVPYGCFIEIEGPDFETIQATTEQLRLNWEARIQFTYLAMFESLREDMDPRPDNATFDQFAGHASLDLKLLGLTTGYLDPAEEDPS